nr:ethylene-responsive transcription factor 1B-like [Ipomoea batatas]
MAAALKEKYRKRTRRGKGNSPSCKAAAEEDGNNGVLVLEDLGSDLLDELLSVTSSSLRKSLEELDCKEGTSMAAALKEKHKKRTRRGKGNSPSCEKEEERNNGVLVFEDLGSDLLDELLSETSSSSCM